MKKNVWLCLLGVNFSLLIVWKIYGIDFFRGFYFTSGYDIFVSCIFILLWFFLTLLMIPILKEKTLQYLSMAAFTIFLLHFSVLMLVLSCIDDCLYGKWLLFSFGFMAFQYFFFNFFGALFSSFIPIFNINKIQNWYLITKSRKIFIVIYFLFLLFILPYLLNFFININLER